MDKNLNSDYKKDPFFNTHRDQITWQIYFPLAVICFIIIGIIILLIIGVRSGSPIHDLTYWASLSIIILLIPWMIGFIFFMGILFVSIYGLSEALRTLPTYHKTIEYTFTLIFNSITNFCDKSANPFIQIKVRYAMIERIVKPKSRIKRIGTGE